MKTAYKFIGKNTKGMYDFVSCTAVNKSIDDVQLYLESIGWSELEFQTSYKPNGHEEHTFKP